MRWHLRERSWLGVFALIRADREAVEAGASLFPLVVPLLSAPLVSLESTSTAPELPCPFCEMTPVVDGA